MLCKAATIFLLFAFCKAKFFPNEDAAAEAASSESILHMTATDDALSTIASPTLRSKFSLKTSTSTAAESTFGSGMINIDEDEAAEASGSEPNRNLTAEESIFQIGANNMSTSKAINDDQDDSAETTADWPAEHEFEITGLNATGELVKWLVPTSNSTGGDSVKLAPDMRAHHWSLEMNEDSSCFWSFYVLMESSNDTWEKLYVSYHRSNNNITLEGQNTPNRMRKFVSLLQPDGTVYLRAGERNVRKFITIVLRSGKAILTMSEQPKSWRFRKNFNTVIIYASNDLSIIENVQTGELWKSGDLLSYDEVPVNSLQTGSPANQKWYVCPAGGNSCTFQTPNSPHLYVENSGAFSVIVTSSSSAYLLLSQGNGNVKMSSETSPETYMISSGGYLERVTQYSLADEWGIIDCSFVSKDPYNVSHYFPSPSEKL